MSDNATNSSVSDDGLGLLVYGAVGYAIQGLLFGVSNLLVACSIAKYEALRSLNQYILLMALAFGDAFDMLGYGAAGIYRLTATLTGQLSRKLTPIECLMRPHVTLWMTGGTLSTTMLAVLSADRLFLVAFPETYLLSLPNPGYAKSIVKSILILMLVAFLVAVGGAVTKAQTASEHVFCYVPMFLDSDSFLSSLFVFYMEKVLASMILGSILTFALVLPVHKWRQSQSGNDAGAGAQAQDAASQKHMTKTLAISCACTLLLYYIPNQIGYWAWYAGHFWLSRTMFFTQLWNCFANVWIYQLRHAELKTALHGLLTRKSLPANLKMWTTNAKVVPAAAPRSKL